MLKPGIIVSIQGHSLAMTIEIARDVIRAGAVAIKTDKPLKRYLDYEIDIIGCKKTLVNNPEKEAYLTPNISVIQKVESWSDFISIDYRKINKELPAVSRYCQENKIKVIADIGDLKDFENIQQNNYYYDYIATTFSVFSPCFRFWPNIALAQEIKNIEKKVIIEGNVATRGQVKDILNAKIKHICIGSAITNPYKLTRKFVTVNKGDAK